jgi:hypothetical protein
MFITLDFINKISQVILGKIIFAVRILFSENQWWNLVGAIWVSDSP